MSPPKGKRASEARHTVKNNRNKLIHSGSAKPRNETTGHSQLNTLRDSSVKLLNDVLIQRVIGKTHVKRQPNPYTVKARRIALLGPVKSHICPYCGCSGELLF